ncbi:YczE/YyaS/YitT family protein [Anoxynatronum buryatiense]|uniref:Uncharacterized protein n=1 Tax=Anoxynatronum buryatiense TaxID=489973 RepID=A0AA46AJT9_9CLOT|nr:hypothetical protein [Anoxynatronum buryatiense]SMP65708.1 hypothetical protein SAMN06296020_11318 [Anoxynatronum buryatiense]
MWGRFDAYIIRPKGQPFTKSLFCLFPKLIIGLFLAALGTVMMIHANIGLFPWGILNAGLANVTGISFGVWSQIIGLFIIVMMTLFKFYPGIGTIFDMFFVGFFIDLLELMAVVPTPSGLVSQVGFSMAGLFVLSYGVSLYMSCGLGASPRDGLMLTLLNRKMWCSFGGIMWHPGESPAKVLSQRGCQIKWCNMNDSETGREIEKQRNRESEK